MTKRYDPFQDAEEKGILVQWVDLPGNLFGLWTGEEILLDSGLTDTQARCSLAHELIHAELDQPVLHKSYAARVEARADKMAAQRLINHRDYELVVRAYSYENQIAAELGVTRKILKAYRSYLADEGEDVANAA